MENGCNMCKMPGRGNHKWMPVSEYEQPCQDPTNSCAMCTCLPRPAPGHPPRLVVDSEGCKKGKRCGDINTGKPTNHRVGDTWDCWSSKMRYFIQD